MSWAWLRTFIEIGRRRLVELKYLTPDRADSIWQVFTDLEAAPGTWMMTPGVLEVIAIRSPSSGQQMFSSKASFGEMPQQDLPNNVMDQNQTSGPQSRIKSGR